MSKKQEIIDAAIREFGEYSYDAASINRIIKASGTSKGTFYHYFSDKKALYFCIIEEAVTIKQRYLADMMGKLKTQQDFFEVMKAQTKAAASFFKEMPELFKFGAMYAKESGTIKDEVTEKYIGPVGNVFQKMVEEGIVEGTFTDRYPPEFIARTIRYLTMNYFDALFEKNETPTVENIMERLDMLFDFMQRGFQP